MARPFSDGDDPQLPLHDPIQHRYELIRPLVLLQDRTATQRAQETATPPETVGRLKRRFDQQGLLGLFPDTLEIIPAGRRRRVSDEVVQELQRLKGLYDGFGYRELTRIIFHKLACPISHHSVKKLWHQLPPASPQQLPLLDYHSYPERAQARMEVITLYAQGWSKRSISQFLHVSRPTITAWIARFAADNLESLEDKSRAPKTTVRKAWLPAMVEIYHLQKRHPDAGGFRIWSLRGKRDLSVRTVERIMALNRQVYPDIPGTGAHRPPASRPAAPSLQSHRGARILVYRRTHDGFCVAGPSRVESDHPRRLFPHHAGGGRGPLGSELGGVDSALYGVSALRGAAARDFR